MNKIEVNGLTFSYEKRASSGRINVLSDLSFTAAEGERIGLIGANGAGKSTLLKLMVGLLTDYEGDMRIGGVSVEKDSLADIRRRMGYVFQDSESQLFMSTVYEDVAFAPRNYGLSEEETRERTMRALESVHMEQMKDRHIYRLSGGEKKRASIASILSMEPEVILMDEPSAALECILTIAEVSKKYDITADTLRYYERIGLIPAVPRKPNGIRDYDQASCQWVELMKCMRKAGVQIEALIEYVALFRQGDETMDARKTILIEQRKRLVRKMQDIQETLERLDYKIEMYEQGKMTSDYQLHIKDCQK